MQNGADQDKRRFLGVKYRMNLREEVTKTGRNLVPSPPDTGKVGEQVERALKPGMVGVGLIGPNVFSV